MKEGFKNMSLASILGLIIVTAVPILIYFYVTRERPQIVYFLSELIPADFQPAATPSYVQQLEIRNIGNQEAIDVFVRIPISATDVRVLPFSAVHNPATIQSDRGHEITYPSLTPGTHFRVLIKSSTSAGLRPNDIGVFHSRGTGVEATTSFQNRFVTSIYWLVVIVWFVLLLGILVWNGRTTYVGFLESRAEYDSQSVLSMNKPWYCNDADWRKIHDKAVQSYLKEPMLIDDLTELPLYRIMCDERPAKISDISWDRLVAKSRDSFVRRIHSLVRNESSLNRLEAWMRLPKPKLSTEVQWNDIRETMFSVYEARLMQRLYSPNSAIKVLESAKLDSLPRDQAEQIEERLYDIQLWTTRFPYDAHDALRFLSDGKPTWMKDSDYKKLQEHCEDLLDAAKVASVKLALQRIVTGLAPDETKRDEIGNDAWAELVKLNDELNDARNKVKALEEAAATELAKAVQDRQTMSHEAEKIKQALNALERKLAIIDRVLTDPSSIEKIERETNPFSPGNWQNLVKVADILRSSKN